MKLRAWIELTGTKQQALAKAIGMPYQRLSACVRGESIPHHDEVVKIYWITLGAVRPEDWYEIGAVPKELQSMLQPSKKRKKRYVRIDADAIAGQRKRDRWKRSALDH
jgi:hypothetical protein